MMLGLGDIELVLSDDHLEEIVVNSSDEPAWVYHKEKGWLKTDISFRDEDEIYNYASEIGRRVGKNISSLHPLLDAHLPSGDRTNAATLYPISTTDGNTITIRRFARDPWTITDFIRNGTVDREVAAFLWLCLQYELNVIVSGGTGAGKTSLLNVLMPFIPLTREFSQLKIQEKFRFQSSFTGYLLLLENQILKEKEEFQCSTFLLTLYVCVLTVFWSEKSEDSARQKCFSKQCTRDTLSIPHFTPIQQNKLSEDL